MQLPDRRVLGGSFPRVDARELPRCPASRSPGHVLLRAAAWFWVTQDPGAASSQRDHILGPEPRRTPRAHLTLSWDFPSNLRSQPPGEGRELLPEAPSRCHLRSHPWFPGAGTVPWTVPL